MSKYVPPHMRRQVETGGSTRPQSGGGPSKESTGDRFSALKENRGYDQRDGGHDRHDNYDGGKGDKGKGGYGGGWGGDRGGDRGGWGKGGQDRSGGRFEGMRDDYGGGKGGGYGGGYGGRGGGGRDAGPRPCQRTMNWFERADNRNSRFEETEEEVFGDYKSKSTGGGIDFDEYDKIPVEVTGDDIDDLPVVTRFSEANFDAKIIDNLINRCGYQRPTPIQKHSFVIVNAKRDLMACAQTGSGKTCAFICPVLNRLTAQGPPPFVVRTPSPVCLVMAPTRELASQIHEETRKFAWGTGIKPVVIYGGNDMREQRAQLNRGCDVLVATPGRLTDMQERRFLSLGLIAFLILDEADRMLDMGFEPQVKAIIEETGMGEHSEFERQSMMFSATFPKEVQYMAQDFLRNYVYLTVGRVGSTNELITQSMVYAENENKMRILLRTLDEHFEEKGEENNKALIFVETKRGADHLERELYHHCVPVTSIHGDRSQREREEALSMFRDGECSVLVATDVAARGLDIPNVQLVVQYDLPNNIDDYTHRIGRTGRAGRRGTAVALINDGCNRSILRELSGRLTESNQERPLWFQDLVRSSGPAGGKFGGKGFGKGGGGRAERLGQTRDIRSGGDRFAKKSYVDNRKTGKVETGGMGGQAGDIGGNRDDDAW